MNNLVLILTIGVCFSAFAASETQTDWQGGAGVAGPVSNWQNKFHLAGDMDWDTNPGQLQLIVNRDENVITTADNPLYVIGFDMDQDGDQDVAGCAYNSGEIFWSENTNGLGTAWVKHSIGVVQNPRFITVADFDGNGYRDIVASSDALNKIVLFRYSPSGWSLGTDITTGFDARQIRSGDFNDDGLPDILGVSSVSGDVCWWKNDGTLSGWSQNYIDGALMGAYVCDVGDFNNDGHLDVVAASNSHNDINAYISQAPYGYSWSKYTIETSYNNPTSLAVADYNNDGSDDFAVASSSGSGNLRWYDFLDTQSSWVYHTMYGASAQNIYDIDAHDMDGDGFPDLLAASMGENKIVWCKNKEYLGEGWVTYSVSSYFSGAVGVSVGDMDGDNVPDVLGCSYYGDKVSWWRVSGYTTPSALTSSILNIQPPDPGAVIWDYLYWAAITPTGTGVRVRLKTSYNSGDMGSWSAWLTSAGSVGSLVTQGGQYLQYQVELFTSNPNVTPSLKDVTILWDPTSIEDQGTAPIDGRKIWLTSGNPVSGSFSIGYNIEQTGFVTIAVYDVTGRSVYPIVEGDLSSGLYSEIVTGLPAGSYAVVMQTETETAAQRIVVLR